MPILAARRLPRPMTNAGSLSSPLVACGNCGVKFMLRAGCWDI